MEKHLPELDHAAAKKMVGLDGLTLMLFGPFDATAAPTKASAASMVASFALSQPGAGSE
jgi:hypothetical protein